MGRVVIVAIPPQNVAQGVLQGPGYEMGEHYDLEYEGPNVVFTDEYNEAPQPKKIIINTMQLPLVVVQEAQTPPQKQIEVPSIVPPSFDPNKR